jgi:hypothetical protein
MRLAHRLPLLLPALLMAACSLDPKFEPDHTPDRLGVWVPDPTATILRVEESGLRVPTFEIVTDTGSWHTVWTQAWAATAAPPPVPFEDFVLTSVLVVGLGDRVGTGYSVTIDSVVSYTSSQVLFATEIQPMRPCSGSSEITAPLHMVRVPNHPPPMDRRVAVVRTPCAG